MEDTMEENLEIEFKILITKEIFDQIINDHQIDCCYKQTNHYLLHPRLSKLRYSLRIRDKNDQFELTLKQPQKQGTLETNLMIDKETKEKILNHQLVTNEVFDKLKPLNLNSTMFITDYSLTTTRYEISTPDGLICVDYNVYNNIIDYELEYEVLDYKKGKQAFLDFISQYHLDYSRNCMSKINRVITSIQNKKQ